jgi:pimeloyl-ACP methyl ester carboxylesterase
MFEMPNAHVNDTDIYYEDHGSGPPLVLIHGLGASHEMWAPQVEAFRETNRVITLDVRGAGRSGRLEGWRNILTRQAADLAALLDQLGIETVALCGVSYGGVFVQRFALDYPDRCHALVISDSFSDTQPHSLEMFGIMVANYLLAPIYLLPNAWLVPMTRQQYSRWPLAQEHLERITREMRGFETMKVRYAINGINYTPQLHQVQTPTLGIVGDVSDLAVNLMRRLTSALPNARLEIVEDSFDPTNLCQPAVFNRRVDDFLQEVGWAAT